MALLLDHHGLRGSGSARARTACPLPAAPPRGRTLDDVLTGTWATLTAAEPATCPVCSGELVARWSAGAGVVGGRCRDCGSEFS